MRFGQAPGVPLSARVFISDRMSMLREALSPRDSRWAVAGGIELFADLDEPDRRQVGVVVARPHPTGWFLSAHFRPEMDSASVEHFAEF
ncbi:MAG: hypothetical protein QOF95_1898, partial [Pseudonocardiales bacterium]|nr:hypothetical protein [Pseudonocardiales bacterium]